MNATTTTHGPLTLTRKSYTEAEAKHSGSYNRDRVEAAPRAYVDVERQGKGTRGEARVVVLARFGRFNFSINVKTAALYAGPTAWIATFSIGWHDRDSFVHGAGYKGNRTIWIGRSIQGTAERNEQARRGDYSLGNGCSGYVAR